MKKKTLLEDISLFPLSYHCLDKKRLKDKVCKRGIYVTNGEIASLNKLEVGNATCKPRRPNPLALVILCDKVSDHTLSYFLKCNISFL